MPASWRGDVIERGLTTMPETQPRDNRTRWGVAGLILFASGLLLPPLAWTWVDDFWVHWLPALVAEAGAVALGWRGRRHWTGKLAVWLGVTMLVLLVALVAAVLALTLSVHGGVPL